MASSTLSLLPLSTFLPSNQTLLPKPSNLCSTSIQSLQPTIRFSLGTESEKKKPNTAANGSWVSPDWLSSITRSLTRDDSGIPVAIAKLDDVSDLLGGALFLPLFNLMKKYGPIYRLAAGPRNFVVVSDPAIAKHVLRNYGKYAKGLVSEVSEFLFGSGFAIAEGPLWTIFSNGRYKSLLHRVIVNSSKSRISVASLHSLPFESVVRPSPTLITNDNPRRYRDTDFASFLQYASSQEPKQKDFLESRKLT